MRLRAVAFAVAGAAFLAACDFEGGDPVQHALRDAAAARQAAALKTTEELEAQAVQARAVLSPDADAAYVAAMLKSHRDALALSATTLAQTRDPAVRALAQAEIEMRSSRLAALEAAQPAAN